MENLHSTVRNSNDLLSWGMQKTSYEYHPLKATSTFPSIFLIHQNSRSSIEKDHLNSHMGKTKSLKTFMILKGIILCYKIEKEIK